jgi:hypothetical protein
MVEDVYGQLVAVGALWDLDALRRDVADVLGRLDETDRPYVPTLLVRALDMFLDAYGHGGQRDS